MELYAQWSIHIQDEVVSGLSGDLGAFFCHSEGFQLPDDWRTGDFSNVSCITNRYISGLQCPQLSRRHGIELFQFRRVSGKWRWSSGRKCLSDRSGHFEWNTARQWLGVHLEFLLPEQYSGQHQQPRWNRTHFKSHHVSLHTSRWNGPTQWESLLRQFPGL